MEIYGFGKTVVFGGFCTTCWGCTGVILEGFWAESNLEEMRWVKCIFLGCGLLGGFFAHAQEGDSNEYALPYPTRNQGPSVEFGQGFQSVAPSMPVPAEGRIKVEPKVESAEGAEGKEAVVTADLKAVVFVDRPDLVKTEGVPGATGVITGIEILKDGDFRKKMEPYLGKPATLTTLNKICRDVIDYYRREGFPVVNVVFP